MEEPASIRYGDQEHQMISTTEVNLIEEDMLISTPLVSFASEVLLDLICIFGITGNIVSMFILSRKQMKSPHSSCLMFLACFDTLFLFALFCNDVVGGSPSCIPWTVIVSKIAWTSSIWTTLFLSAKLYVDVFYTLRAMTLCSYRRIALINLSILLFAVCFNIPHFCLMGQVSWDADLEKYFPYYYSRHVLQRTACLPPWITENQLFFEIWCMYLDMVVMFCLPLLLFIVFNSSSYFALKRIAVTRCGMIQYQQGGRPLYKLRVFKGVMFIFFVTHLVVLLFAIPHYYGILPTSVLGLVQVSYFSVYVNSGVKFIIYCALWEDFRNTLKSTFCTCRFQEIAVINNVLRKRSTADVPLPRATEPSAPV